MIKKAVLLDAAAWELPRFRRREGTGGITGDTGHRSVAMVRVYTRRADAFADHAGEGLL